MDNKLEFVVEDTEYTLHEFQENFDSLLPKIVFVAQGYCGDIINDTFGREQIIRIETYTNQRRVVAEVHGKQDGRRLSIPLDYPICFRVIHHQPFHSKATAKTLSQIVEKHTLPVRVEFDPDVQHVVKVGTTDKCTSHMPDLVLVDTFEVGYLIGNTLTSAGALADPQPVAVPLYLHGMKLSLVTGIKGHRNRREWESYQTDLTIQVNERVEFERDLINTEIAVYNEQTEHKTPIDPYSEPGEMYYNIKEALGLRSGDTGRPASPENVYEPIAENPVPLSLPKNPNASLTAELKLKLGIKQDRPPPIPKKPKAKAIVSPDENFDTPKPPLPRRTPVTHPVTPIRHEQEHASNVAAINRTSSQDQNDNRVSDQASSFSDVENREVTHSRQDIPGPASESMSPGSASEETDVLHMSVERLGEWMAVLNLGKYVEQFRYDQVDGEMLLELDESVLRDEYNFSFVEAKKLMKFAREGYIPRNK